VASVRSAESLERLRTEFPEFHFTLKNEELIEGSSYIFVGLKPHLVVDILKSLQTHFSKNQHVLSFCARVTLAELTRAWESGDLPQLHRLMANTAMERCEGILGHVSAQTLPQDLYEILSSLGLVLQVPETHFDAFTTLTASAPAFVLEFLRGLEDFSQSSGLSLSISHQSLPQLLRGIASLLESDPNISKRIEQIATPGGMTAAGLEILRQNQVSKLAAQACVSTLEKAKTL
jgi:pyrroline-5-carboxylate reductase